MNSLKKLWGGNITPYTKGKVAFFKALLPFMVLLHHYSLRTDFLPIFKNLGISIVACFFMMSGYGLMTSYLKKRDTYMEHFLSHRFKAVLIPYIVTLVLCVVCMALEKGYSIFDYFSNIPFEQYVPNTWFVWVLICGYVAFKLIFSCNISIRMKIIVFTAVSLCYFAICILEGVPVYWYYSSPAILVGLLWRYKEKAIMEIISKHVYLFPVMAILAYVMLNLLHMNIINILVISVCLLFIWVAYVYDERWLNNKVTNFLSGISYEVYLCHGILIGIMAELSKSHTLNLILLIMTTILFSVCVNKISNFIKRVL